MRLIPAGMVTGLATGLILAGCASGGTNEPAPAAAPAPAIASDLVPATDLVPRSGLGAQALESGECALFLWSKTDPDRFIFFQKAQSGEALMKIGAETARVSQTANRGEIFGQFMTEQGFAAPGGEQVLLHFEPGEPLEGGQRIASGQLSITSPEGWRTLVPVLGVRACQP